MGVNQHRLEDLGISGDSVMSNLQKDLPCCSLWKLELSFSSGYFTSHMMAGYWSMSTETSENHWSCDHNVLSMHSLSFLLPRILNCGNWGPLGPLLLLHSICPDFWKLVSLLDPGIKSVLICVLKINKFGALALALQWFNKLTFASAGN